MSLGIQGRFFSFTSASVSANQDLIARAETLTGISNIVAKKITLISSGSLAIDINGLGVNSTLYQDADLLYKLSLDARDVEVSSLVIGQTSACPVWLALVF